MSKLSDRIRKTNHTEPAPMGFAPIARTSSPTMLTLVRLAAGDAAKAADAAAKGADGVIVDGLEPKKLKGQDGKANGVVFGVRLQKAERNIVLSLKEAGADFAVVDIASAAADALLEENIGYVLLVPAEADDTRLRLIADLGVDALLVQAPAQPVTVEGMLELRRIAALSRTPLLADVPADADATLLQILRDSGVAGVVIEGSALGKLASLRERIAALPARGRRQEAHADATVPAQASHDHGEDDDEDY